MVLKQKYSDSCVPSSSLIFTLVKKKKNQVASASATNVAISPADNQVVVW